MQQFADETGLRVHVSHFPPGTSKWNKIELEDDQTTEHFHDYLGTYRVPYDKRSEGRPDWG